MSIWTKFTDWVNGVQSLEVTPTDPVVFTGPKGFLTTGAWVMTPEGRVGILGEGGIVTMTKADGTTIMTLNNEDQIIPFTVQYPVNQLKRAPIAEIPRSRYVDRNQLLALGYGD